jgi:ADP-ribosyl-[dinitrogen reductase] hydrolase
MEIERFEGLLIGLAVADAVGTTVEFSSPGTFTPVSDMVGGGPFNLLPGEWTDDTSMALCLAESLIACKGFDPVDQLQRYLQWYRHGHLSSNGVCFDIGNTVRQALERFERTREPYCGSVDVYSAGNGSLMRLAPVVMAFAANPEVAVHWAGESSRTTHGAAVAVDACRYFSGLLVGALHGETKEKLVSASYTPVEGLWQNHPLSPAVHVVAQGSFLYRQPPQIIGSGYVVRSLEAALWAFANSNSYRSGCLMAVNLGNDADTTAAIFGQLAGAYYGVDGIPKAWRERLAKGALIQSFAQSLFELAYKVA